MRLEVYLHAAVVRGVLATNQDRLSSYLIVRQDDTVFSLKDATLELYNRKPVSIGADEYLVYMHEVFLIADLTSESEVHRSAIEHLYVKKDQSRALFSVGPYLLQGNVHLLPGTALHELLMEKAIFYR